MGILHAPESVELHCLPNSLHLHQDGFRLISKTSLLYVHSLDRILRRNSCGHFPIFQPHSDRCGNPVPEFA